MLRLYLPDQAASQCVRACVLERKGNGMNQRAVVAKREAQVL